MGRDSEKTNLAATVIEIFRRPHQQQPVLFLKKRSSRC